MRMRAHKKLMTKTFLLFVFCTLRNKQVIDTRNDCYRERIEYERSWLGYREAVRDLAQSHYASTLWLTSASTVTATTASAPTTVPPKTATFTASALCRNYSIVTWHNCK
jgi:hypothetical protein